MNDQNHNEPFHYMYSAEQQEEIEKIRRKYAPPEEDKMEQLRRLDARVTEKATILSIAAGVIGALIMGIGLCCTMVWQGVWLIPGIVIGTVGIGIIIAAYPLYQRVLKKEREKIAPEMLRLTDELMK